MSVVVIPQHPEGPMLRAIWKFLNGYRKMDVLAPLDIRNSFSTRLIFSCNNACEEDVLAKFFSEEIS